jgi:hypothetical protein
MKTALTGDEANAQRPQEAYRRSHSKLGQLLEDPYQPSCPCPAPNPLVQVDKQWPPGQIRCTDLSDCKLFFLFFFFFCQVGGCVYFRIWVPFSRDTSSQAGPVVLCLLNLHGPETATWPPLPVPSEPGVLSVSWVSCAEVWPQG